MILCYLEAIHSNILDLIRKKKQPFSSSSPVTSDGGQISQEIEVTINNGTDLDSPTLSTETSSSNSLIASIRLKSVLHGVDTSFPIQWLSILTRCWHTSRDLKTDNVFLLPPLPPLPSTLLCLHRTFSRVIDSDHLEYLTSTVNHFNIPMTYPSNGPLDP